MSSDGAIVTREALQQEIWADRVHVDFEHGLNVCIRQVRTALGDDADVNAVIVTCPREGDKLGVAVQPIVGIDDAEAPTPERHQRPAAAYVISNRHWRAAAALLVLAIGGAWLTYSCSDTSTAAASSNAAERAPTLGPQLAETHVALAELGYRLEDDTAKAEREFSRAFELDDHSASARQRYAAFLHHQRRFDDALARLRIAYQLDPRSIMRGRSERLASASKRWVKRMKP